MPSSLNGIGVTFNDGTQLQSANEAGGNYVLKTFTAPGTYAKPAGLKAVKVTVIGGGGGGGGARGATNLEAGHGGAGGVSIRFLPAPSIPGPVAVTRGAGGGGGGAPLTSRTTAGVAGGTSSFGGFLSATGGGGAIAGGTNNGTPNIGGVGSGGNINLSGGASPESSIGRNNAACNNQFSFAGQPRAPFVGNGQVGTAFGGGGTGARAGGDSTIRTGGAGAAGLVIIEEFF